MHQAEEDLLVLAAQKGNKKALNLLCDKYHNALLRYAFKVCNDKEIAQDAVQESWIKFAKNIRKLNDPRALKSWLFRLVRWSTIDLMRDANRHQGNEQNSVELADEETRENNGDKSDELMLAINRLPAIEKQMIHLFYLDELKISEISAVLDIPSGTIKSRLNRARTLLKQKFDTKT